MVLRSSFFQIRNSFVGLLDPVLHTSEYVYSTSFTLFSVVCAMGCGISSRARDRILYPTLLSIAEANVRWSIAMSVRSVEVIQAIINLKYWAPLCERHADDPYWLQVSYLTALGKHSLVDRSLSSLLGWHSEAFGILETTRDLRCTPDGSPSSQYLPILDFYMGHSLLVLSATALKDMKTVDKSEASTEMLIVTERTFKVASRALNVILYDEILRELILGIQNNMYIMIAHAITEMIQAIKRGCVASSDAIEAATKIHAISRRLEKLGQQLPSSSPIHLYKGLARVFAAELSRIMKSKENDFAQGEEENVEESPDWLKAFDGGSLDSAAWLDLGFLSSGQPLSESTQFTGAEGLTGLLFP
ncbi:fungal transcriptional regulatory protein [Colletotrichum kahawae]|uniref:Fungal transcriptional regulatory protein n=1 Tax=Colletotrichum kahawae TaxID=34407 RepID=A0AAD9YMF7_COLKA|nr:fungal transcriptional regulatory protein [Colletotrichum kahawae]